VWQEEILADIRQTVEREQREIEGKPDPEDVADFGFFYPYDYVRTMATVIESSNWSCLPDGGRVKRPGHAFNRGCADVPPH